MLTFLIFGVLTALAFRLTAVGVDFGFAAPILAEALALLVWSSMGSLIFGWERRSAFKYGAAAFLFSLYIIFDTNQILKRYTDDEYIAAAANLYLDVLNLFLDLLEEMFKNSK